MQIPLHDGSPWQNGSGVHNESVWQIPVAPTVQEVAVVGAGGK